MLHNEMTNNFNENIKNKALQIRIKWIVDNWMALEIYQLEIFPCIDKKISHSVLFSVSTIHS